MRFSTELLQTNIVTTLQMPPLLLQYFALACITKPKITCLVLAYVHYLPIADHFIS